MKKYLLTFIILMQLTHSLRVHASGAIAGATEPTQILNNIGLGLLNATDLTTSISTTIDMTKNTILDPIANALIANALNSASKDVLSWVGGGFSGGAPLIISNPQSFIQGKGLDVIKGALGGIPTNSPFGDSIFSSILGSYKGTNDLTGQLKSLSQSNIPGIIQSNMCADAQLTQLAKQSVSDPNNAQEVAAKKTQLYNYACVGNASDPQTAARLNDLGKQNPNIGGWDKMLAIAGGDNDAVRAMRARDAVAQKEAEAKDIASKKVFGGESAISQTQCNKYADVVDDQSPAVCLDEQTITPGKTVNDMLSKASSAGLDRLSNIMGAGSLTGLLSNLAMSAITGGIQKALSGGGRGGGGAVNVSTTLTASRPIVQDLVNDPDRKRELINTMEKQLSYYSASLDKLEATDRMYLADLGSYESKIQSGKACFDGLVRDNLTTNDHPAFAFYASRQNNITSTKNSLNQELSKINEARQLINTTSSRIHETNSSQEMGTTFNGYMAAVDNQNLPSIQAEPMRSGEYQVNKSNVSRDTDVTTYQNTCAQLQQTQYYNGSNNN
jgi:hypothetical protein